MSTDREAESWLVARICRHGACELDGVSDPCERRRRMRQAITECGLECVIVGRRDGKCFTYAQAFERLYQEKL